MNDTNRMTTKQRATVLLRKYDHMRAELRNIERELSKEVTAYGREQGIWGFTKDMFRIRLEAEQAARLEDQADRHAWDRQHG